MKIICRSCRKQIPGRMKCPDCGTPSVDGDGMVMTSKGLAQVVAEKTKPVIDTRACQNCGRSYKTARGLANHIKTCKPIA